MSYLLDTCVLSEFTRRTPDPHVICWMDSIDEEKLHLSVITIGEIRRGIERLSESRRKTDLFAWLSEDLIERFGQRILPLDIQTMSVWGSLVARIEKAGRIMPVMDSLIAAATMQYQLILATRNVSDFSSCGVQVVNPWE
jgi:predicted nucleic acid-binding protein